MQICFFGEGIGVLTFEIVVFVLPVCFVLSVAIPNVLRSLKDNKRFV